MEGLISTFCSGCFLPVLPYNVSFFHHCLFGDWSQALPPSCSFRDLLVLWRNNSGLPLLQSSSLYLSHDSILCILWFIPACLWETVKVSVITAQWHWGYIASQQMVNFTGKLWRKPNDLVWGNRNPHHFLWSPPHLWVILSLGNGNLSSKLADRIISLLAGIVHFYTELNAPMF